MNKRWSVILLLVAACFGQSVPVIISPAPQFESLLSNGKPNAFGCVFTYNSGTTNPLATYTDFTGNTVNQNPVLLNSNGAANIWLQSGIAYSFSVKSAGGVNCASGSTVYTVRGISGGTSQVITVVPYSANPQFTVTSQNTMFQIALTGNAVALPLTVVGIQPPSFIEFQITQDSVGGHQFTWPSNVVGGAPIGANANQVTTQTFVWNGVTGTAVGLANTGTGESGNSLSLAGAAALTSTAQSGTGSLCLTTGCALVNPSINGVTIPNSPATYITLPNAATPGTTQYTLTKLAVATPVWSKRNDQTGTGSGSPQAAAAFSANLTNPSLIVVFTSGPVGTFTVTDTASNTYVDCGQGQIVYNTSATGVQCFYALNTHTTASNVVTFASTGGGAMTVAATEWTGGAIVSPVDVTQNSGPNASTGVGGGQNTSSGAATANGPDLVIGLAGVQTGTLSVGTGFTSTSIPGLEYEILNAPTALAATWSDNTNNDSYAALMVAFKPYAGAFSTAVISSATDTGGAQGITVSGAGITGTAVIQQSGTSTCTFDGPTNSNDYVQISSTVAGNCHDTGSSVQYPVTGQVIGHVLSTNAAGGNFGVELLGPEFPSISTVKLVCANPNNATVSANVTTSQFTGTCQLPSGSLNANGTSIRITSFVSIIPGGTATSAFGLGLSSSSLTTPTAIGQIATQASSSTGWTISAQMTCTVYVPGASGKLICVDLTVIQGGTAAVVNGTMGTAAFNLTGPIYVGPYCKFGTGSTSNTCTQQFLTVEQLN